MEQWQLYITELQKISAGLFVIIYALVIIVMAIIVLSIRIENGSLPSNSDTTYYLDVLKELFEIFMLFLCVGLCIPMLKVTFIMKGMVL